MKTEASPATDIAEPIVDTAPVAAPEAAQPDATPAQSSSADTTDAKPDATLKLRDVVQNVIKPEEAEQPAPSASTDGQDAATTGEAKADTEEPAAEAEVPFHNHPRWKQMISERDALREPAENYQKITDYMQAVGLQANEVAEGFEVMGQLKSQDPAVLTKARDWFANRLDFLNRHLGETLPEDLQQKVDDGLVDIDVAKEFARTRASSTLLESQNTQRQQQEQQTRDRDQAAIAQTQVVDAANAWEQRTAAKDPDYSKKASLIEAQCRAIVQRTGYAPRTPEDAVNLADAAYKEVNELLKPMAPARRPIAAPTSGMSVRTTTAPTNLKQAVRAALSR